MIYISAEELWFLMHHTLAFNPTLKALAMTCYCDDSGSHEDSNTVVVSGIVMNQITFGTLDTEWGKMLREFQIEALHMTDFIRPHGRYSTMYPEMKKALFATVTEIVNKQKEYSISVAIPQKEFKELLSMEIYKKLVGPYAMAFMIIVMFNSEVAEYPHILPFYRTARMSYLADKGSKHHHTQIDAAHTTIVKWEQAHGRARTGAIAFDLDERVTALQAADAVAWTYHRQQEYGVLEDEFSPLLELIKSHINYVGGRGSYHVSLPVPRDGLKILADGINRWIENKGKMPSVLSEMIDEPAKKVLGAAATTVEGSA